MRASTMGILALAVLIGLGATAGAKYAGLFDTVVPPVVKEEPIRILAAKNNIFAGTMITAKDVVLRELSAQEKKQYDPSKLPPPQLQWANYRVAARNLNANDMLQLEDFNDLEMAKGVPERISPGMKSVQLVLPKERAAGGLLRLGDYVDIMMTSDVAIPGTSGKDSITQTAIIARDARIIVKRDMLFTVIAPPTGADNLVTYTVEVNPYRAALIEYAKTHGTLSVSPSSGATMRQPLAPGAKRTFSDPNSAEYRDEDLRIQALEKGELTVGDQDLYRIFKIRPTPPEPAPPPPHTIEIVNGSGKGMLRQFPNSGENGGYETSEPPMLGGGTSGGSSSRAKPSGPVKFVPAGKDCPTCGKKKN